MLGYNLLKGLFESEAAQAQKRPVVPARRWTESPPKERERIFVKSNSILSFDLFGDDWDYDGDPWSFVDWFANIGALLVFGFFAITIYHEAVAPAPVPKPAIVKEVKKPEIQYRYNLSPAEFAELQYRLQIEEIDRQVAERIRRNHEDNAK